MFGFISPYDPQHTPKQFQYCLNQQQNCFSAVLQWAYFIRDSVETKDSHLGTDRKNADGNSHPSPRSRIRFALTSASNTNKLREGDVKQSIPAQPFEQLRVGSYAYTYNLAWRQTKRRRRGDAAAVYYGSHVANRLRVEGEI